MSAYVGNDKVHVSAATPKLRLQGTETGGGDLSVRENAGKIEVYDEVAAAKTAAFDGASIAAGTIPATALVAGTIKVLVPILISDSHQSGLAAASTGVKWTSYYKFTVDTQNLLSATLRATWTATNTDSVTAIEVYDGTGAAVLGSVSGNAGTDATAAITGFTTGDLLQVRLNVTTASATSTATTSLIYAVLEVTYGAS